MPMSAACFMLYAPCCRVMLWVAYVCVCMLVQGLLEMMHEKMSEWVTEFISDIAQLSPQLTLPTPIRCVMTSP